MHRITPKIKNTSAYICSCCLLIAGLLLFFFSMQSGWSFAIIPQLIGAVLLVASLYIFGAHIAREFTFELGPRDARSPSDIYDLVIYETRGRQAVIVCRIGLEDIQKIAIVTRDSRRELSSETKGLRRFSYDRTFLPKKQLAILTDEDAIRVTYDEELLKMLGGER